LVFYNWLGIKNRKSWLTFRNCHPIQLLRWQYAGNFKTGTNNPEKTWLPGIFYSRRNYIHRKTKAITGNALRLQLDSRKHLNAKNCLQMEIER
jgi:hypothetical protein